MNQTTAVVLDTDQIRRNAVCSCLINCDVVPICTDDEWLCLENILHVKPAFVLMGTISRKMAIHFVVVVRAIDNRLPIIIVSNKLALREVVGKQEGANLFFLSASTMKKDLRELVATFGSLHMDPVRTVMVSGVPAVQQIIRRLPFIGRFREPVLIQGETGVGKKRIAREIYYCVEDSSTVWRSVPARELSSNWLRQLHRILKRPHRSGKPLIFFSIENIERLDRPMQAQLLQIMDMLTDKANYGEESPVRLVFLAETDLWQMSRNRQFREDLYHRLTVLKIHIPPLREREGDVALLADFFALKYGIASKNAISRLPDGVRTAFEKYHWPGNVAQLKGAIKKTMLTGAEKWEDELKRRRGAKHLVQTHPVAGIPSIEIEGYLQKLINGKSTMSLKTAKRNCVERVEKDIIKTVLFKTHGNCKKAAIILDISYKSMLNKVKAYELIGG